jgi:hypothetical protein
MPSPRVETTAEEEFRVDFEPETAEAKSGKVHRDRGTPREEMRQEAIACGRLLEGPQLPDAEVSQDDIDSLVGSL